MHTRRRVNVILVVLAILVILACVGCCEEDDWECQMEQEQQQKTESEHLQSLSLDTILEVKAAQEAADQNRKRGDPSFTPSPEQ